MGLCNSDYFLIDKEKNDFYNYNMSNMNNLDNFDAKLDSNPFICLSNNNYFPFSSKDDASINDIFKEKIFHLDSIMTKENTKEIRINNINDIVNDYNIFKMEIDSKENNKENKFNALKTGRPKKDEENNIQRYHNKNSFDNARKKIYNSCKLSIYNFIHEYIPSNLGIKLHIPTIEKQIGYSYRNNNKFFNKKIYDIFCDSSPKRLKNEIKECRNEYNYNKEKINILLEQEKNSPEIKIKILNKLFNLTFYDFLMVYLNDEDKLKIGDLTIDLKGFRTFGQCFNESKNKYTQAQKNMFRKYIFDIIGNKKSSRKARALIHK